MKAAAERVQRALDANGLTCRVVELPASTRADADWVKQTVGYVIGGVPPLGHLGNPRVFFDPDLLKYTTVWAAAGTPNAVFEIAPADLQRVTQGEML